MKRLKTKRIEKVKRRRNFFPTLVLTLIFWLLTSLIIYLFDPSLTGAVPLFFASFFISIFLTLSLIFANSRRGILFSSGIFMFLILRYFGVGNILNLILILAIITAFEIYLSKN
ncbi:hypothetical protein A2V55_01035 [Candidatus Woesebacteria bacterium RBG_19FT_COMBO_37_29]|uniref:Uncharacterized protein n=1 Tax=Candidatus Woesebacteria bacterium RBG_19FT_COMBO_37_29 TaxID=1802486 RepID=A0A1F7XNX0_9BACT|nr:MAG: hypothetical protein A2V55_01035 [Candidatus Woesebacteria bacterium RBG_19FT_COMBO_37_29]